MINFIIALVVAAVEIGLAAIALRKVFGHAALRDSVMRGLYVLLGLGLLLKGWLDTIPMQWFAINFMLFLLAVVYRGDMKKQALIAAGLAVVATGLDAAVKLLLLPML